MTMKFWHMRWIDVLDRLPKTVLPGTPNAFRFVGSSLRAVGDRWRKNVSLIYDPFLDCLSHSLGPLSMGKVPTFQNQVQA